MTAINRRRIGMTDLERARHRPGKGVDVGPVGSHSTAHLNLTRPMRRMRVEKVVLEPPRKMGRKRKYRKPRYAGFDPEERITGRTIREWAT